MHKEITDRIYIKLQLGLLSPLSISNCDEKNSDKDVITDYDGDPFIPGTSIAGAIRNYLDVNVANKIFGYSEGEIGSESAVIVYDAYLSNYKKTVRDGIALDDHKITIVGKKFDYEIIETGAITEFRFELLISENEKLIKDSMIDIIGGIKNGDIRFGHNKNRGNGRFDFKEIFVSIFSKESNNNDWTKFAWSDMKDPVAEEWKKRIDNKIFRKFVIPLNLEGGISIRKYSTNPGNADFAHITCNSEPIIPGTSWNGAIRHRAKSILEELKVGNEGINELIDETFGFVKEEKKKKQIIAKASNIVIGESILKNSVPVPMTRNRINRFDNSTIDGALYSEISYFGGETFLEIMVNRKCEEWVFGILLLVVKDLQNGFLAIGGQTSIGRGLFSAVDNEIIFSEEEEKKLMNALKDKIIMVSEAKINGTI